MTETDATKRPLGMPERFIPYLEKHRIYKIFKDMVNDLVINLPKDHLKHMKVFFSHHLHCSDTDRVILLISPKLTFDVQRLVKELIKDVGFFVITRRCVMDRYEKVKYPIITIHEFMQHDDYQPGCMSPVLMSAVTKVLTLKDPVPHVGWLMFDHPCTVREARCLQQDGVLPTVTLVLIPTPPKAPPAENLQTPARSFFDQDFEGLQFAYKATLKEVHVDPSDDFEKISNKCFNAIRACSAGAQGPRQGHHVLGAPGVYRVLLIGPPGSGRRTHARALAKHFGFVCLQFDDLYSEALKKNDQIGEKLRHFGPSIQLRADIVQRRILEKDCIEHGWVITSYPSCGIDFEHLDNMSTPPNRIIFLNADWETCSKRTLEHAMDWCTGMVALPGSGPRVLPHPRDNQAKLDNELEYYFTEALAELHAAAGITAVEIDALQPFDQVQVKIQAAVIAAPAFDIERCFQLRNVIAD